MEKNMEHEMENWVKISSKKHFFVRATHRAGRLRV